MGPPIPTAFDFLIANRLAELQAEREAQESLGYQSEDEREIESHDLPPSPPFQAWAMDSPPPLSPLTPIHDPVDLAAVPPMSPLPPSASIAKTPPSRPVQSSPKSSKTGRKPRHKKTDHRKAGAKKCRLKQRLLHMEKTHAILKAVNIRRRRNLDPISTNISAANLDHASTAWIGKPEHFDRVHYSLAHLTGPEFNFIKYHWDGK
jgi:hypothetical protein